MVSSGTPSTDCATKIFNSNGGHKDLKDYVRFVWEEDSPLLVRSFVEQAIDLNLSNVTGLEKIGLHPPLYGDEPIAVYMPPKDTAAILDHETKLKLRYPDLPTRHVLELPKRVQFPRAVPAIIRKIASEMETGVPLDEMEHRKWLDLSAWTFRT